MNLIIEKGFVIEERYSNWQQKDVRTILVNSYSKNPTQRSISAALSIANPYDRIELSGGSFNESVSISIPIEFVASEGETPVISSRNSCLTITGNVDVYFQDIELVCKSGSKADASIVVMGGSVHVLHCTVSSILIGGSGNITAKRTSVCNSTSGYGVTVQDAGGGEFSSCTVQNHFRAGMDIDTSGQLLVDGCTITNDSTGDALVISGISSSVNPPGAGRQTRSRGVTITNCTISGAFRGADSGDTATNVTRLPCGAVVCGGAEPTLQHNEFLQGEIGLLLDSAGPGQILRNAIRCQRTCGILVLSEKGSAALSSACAKVSGHNVLDRCHIGIDVQSRASATGAFDVDDSGGTQMFSKDLPSRQHRFHWLKSFAAQGPPNVGEEEDDVQKLLRGTGEVFTAARLKSELRDLVECALNAYPTCLDSSYVFSVGNPLSTDDVAGPASNSLADLIADTFGLSFSGSRDEAAFTKMESFRGPRGIDISETAFWKCTLCAIRFGKQSYGLVERCTFEDGGSHAIIVDCGAHPLITACRFSRSAVSSILLHNFAHPFIIGNEISDGCTDGIDVTLCSSGIIVGNRISHQGRYGVRIAGHSRSILAGNAVILNQQGGMHISEESSPCVFFNHFVGNSIAQLTSVASSHPIVAFNNFQSADRGDGIVFANCSLGTAFHNTVDHNRNGIVIETDADPLVEQNIVRGNTVAGVLCRNNGLGVIVNNTLDENCGPNVLVCEGSASSVRANSIRKGFNGGVLVNQEGCGLFEHNWISENSVANVLVSDPHTTPLFLANRIFSSSNCGAVCTNGSVPTFRKNHFYENKLCGIYVIQDARPIFTYNSISREVVGIMASDGGKGQFTHNTIDNCYGHGILSQQGGEPHVLQNVIKGSHMSGLLILDEGIGVFEENDIHDNDVGLQLGSSLPSAVIDISSVYIRSTSTSGSKAAPTAASGGSRGILLNRAHIISQRQKADSPLTACQITRNQIHHNRHGGVLLDGLCGGVVQGNDIYENNAFGICGDTEYSAKRAEAILKEKFAASSRVIRPTGALSKEGVDLLFKDNTIRGHQLANLNFVDYEDTSGRVRIRTNSIQDAPIGIYVGARGVLPAAEGNTIHHCLDGVYMEEGGRGLLVNNTIEACQYTGAYIRDSAAPNFASGNIIRGCGMAGIMVDVGGRGTYSKGTIAQCTVGVIVFCGPTSPFAVSYEELTKARLVSASPVFTENTIVENETHGVLVLSVITGCSLRNPRKEQLRAVAKGEKHLAPSPFRHGMPNSATAAGEHLYPLFIRNSIHRNRLAGVFHDRFNHWNFTSISSGTTGELERPMSSTIKNAYGGYEVLLGTSLVLSSEDHQRQRELKQVTFKENTVSECGIGFVAGYGCHPFLLKNKLISNTFFGVWLRFGSAVMANGCEISRNGLAGIYAASGAKGFISMGKIHSNNTLCRPLDTPSKKRVLDLAVFHQHFTTPPEATAVMSASPSESLGVLMSCEQMTQLLAVHAFTIFESLHVLTELASASSAATSLATGCVPSASFVPEVKSQMAGVGIEDFIRLYPADGGIGVWVEKGSRTKVSGNDISNNKRVGVLFSKGVLRHHHVLQSNSEPAAPANRPASKNKADEATPMERHPLACAEYAAMFTAHPLCALGTMTSVQVTGSNDKETSSLSVTQTSYAEIELTASALDGKAERQDSIHHALIADNDISHNDYGVYMELYGGLKPVMKPPPSPQGKGGRSPRRASYVAPVASDSGDADNGDGESLSAADTERLLDSLDTVDYAVVIQGNTIHDNQHTGIFCQHVVEIYCTTHVFPHRGALNDAVMKTCDDVRNQIILQKPLEPLKAPYHMEEVTSRITNALITGNSLHGNRSFQGEVTSQFVVITEDRTRTLLQFDTMAPHATSPFSSRVLLQVPAFAGLLQCPPPCVCVWDGNAVRNANTGVVVSGYVGCTGAHFTRNRFENIVHDAILIQGHLAASSVGAGNIFKRNGIAIRNQALLFGTEGIIPGNRANDLTTRIYRNHFSEAVEASVLCEPKSPRRLLIYKNTFVAHPQGTVGLLCNTDSAGALVSRNAFLDSYTPVLVTKGASRGKHLIEVSSTVFKENLFRGNYIGAIICGGADPLMTNNLFVANICCGVELVDSGSACTMRGCVFRNHCEFESPFNPMTVADAMRGDVSHMTPPPGDSLTLLRGTYKLRLIPVNRFVLNANSERRLPAGMLIGPHAEGRLEKCIFTGNDVGVDAAREHTNETGTRVCQLVSCVFLENKAAGVLVRRAEPNCTAVGLAAMKAVHTESTVLEECFFMDNVSDTDTRGDVIAMKHGQAVFRKCTFFGTVHCMADSQARFTNSTFLPPREGKDVDDGTQPAIVLHDGAHSTLERCAVSKRKKGLLVLPGACGNVVSSTFTACHIAVTVAPYTRTSISHNRILHSQDCAVLAYGGLLSENVIFGAPVGVVLENASQFPRLNAIPTCLRKVESIPWCSKNTVTKCETDGFLVTGSASVEKNVVSACKNGISLLCPPAVVGTQVPNIQLNKIYDNIVGVCWKNAAVATVLENDIFDNKISGVVIISAATGTLQGNRISSTQDHGALDTSTDCQVKVLANTIRNQFSPAFNRTNQAGRLTAYEETCKAVGEEVSELLASAAALTSGNNSWLSAAQLQVSKLGALEDVSDMGLDTPVAGSPSKSLRSRTTNLEDTHSSTRSITRSKLSYSDLQSPPARRSAIANNARRHVNLRSELKPFPVLIHVFSQATSHTVSTSVGKMVARIFGEPPLSTKRFVTTITTSLAQLLTHLQGTSKNSLAAPFITIVVFNSSQAKLSASEHEVLAKLHGTCRPQAANKNALHLRYLVLPESISQDTEVMTSNSNEGMSLSAFGHNAHATFVFHAAVEDVLSQLLHTIAEQTNKTSKKLSTSSDIQKGDQSPAPEVLEFSQTVGVSQGSPTLTRERLSNVLGLLTPEALGITTRRTSKTRKKTDRGMLLVGPPVSGSITSLTNNNATVRKNSIRASRGPSQVRSVFSNSDINIKNGNKEVDAVSKKRRSYSKPKAVPPGRTK